MTYDAVIIGAGPSGLAAAARLAHFDVKVCLLESHCRLGGLNSWHHVKGREISSGLHAFTNFNPTGRGGPLGKLLRQLRISYADLELCPQGVSSIRFPSATLHFSNDLEYFRNEVARVFPAEIDNFDRFRSLIRETDEGELTDRRTSAREVLTGYIRDPLLVDMLLCPVMFYGNPGGVGDGHDGERTLPDMDWLLFCVIWKCIFETGIGYPAAGIRPLWESLAKRIVEDGSVVRMSSRVAHLKTDGGRVTAAVLESGEEITGNMFFSSTGAVETDLLLGKPRTPEKPAGSITVAEGICLLDCPAVDAGMTDTVIFFSLEDRLDFREPRGLLNDSAGVVCAPGNYQLPEGHEENIIKISQLASFDAWKELTPEAYEFAKQDVAAGMASALGKLGIVPTKAQYAFGKYGIFADLFTPMTLLRYTGHADAAIYGSPVKSRTGATSCANLFLMGADQGFHGIVGAMLSGVAMVNLHFLTKHA